MFFSPYGKKFSQLFMLKLRNQIYLFIYLLNFGFVSKKDVIIEKLFDFMVLI